MGKTWLVIIGAVLVILVMGIMQFLVSSSVLAPEPVIVEPLSIESNNVPSLDVKEVTVSSSVQTGPILPSIAKGDTIASWTFKGAYADNPDLIAKAEAEIKRLSDLVGTGAYPDVSLYIGIANQYELLGDGKNQYDYLGSAIGASGITGLPWHNLGVLMERLGALNTARVAYERSTLLQPEMKFYHYAYFEFLITRMKEGVVDIEKEFAAAIRNLGQNTDILQLYSEWKNS